MELCLIWIFELLRFIIIIITFEKRWESHRHSIKIMKWYIGVIKKEKIGRVGSWVEEVCRRLNRNRTNHRLQGKSKNNLQCSNPKHPLLNIWTMAECYSAYVWLWVQYTFPCLQHSMHHSRLYLKVSFDRKQALSLYSKSTSITIRPFEIT